MAGLRGVKVAAIPAQTISHGICLSLNRGTYMEEKQPVTGGNGRTTSPETAATELPAVLREVTDLTWEREVESEARPVAVMFYSPTCVFCHQMEPYFRNFAGDYRDVVVFVKISIVANPWTAERYGIRSTPTFSFFCSKKLIRQMVGAVYPALLKKTIEEVLLHGEECAKNSTAIDYEITGYG